MTLGTRRSVVAVHGTRGITRDDLVANVVAPPIEVSPADGIVTLDSHVLGCDPVGAVPLSRLYLLA
jgi:urease subunit alpha